MKIYVKSAVKMASDENAKNAAKIAKTSTDPRILSELASDKRITVRKNVAANPHTPESALLQLVDGADFDISTNIARNPGATAKVLLKLSQIPNLSGYAVCSILAHPNVTNGIIYRLAKHPDECVRGCLIGNASQLPDNIIDILSKDPDEYVRRRLLRYLIDNKIISEADYAQWAKDPSEKVRETVARHTTSAELLTRLSYNHSPNVRYDVARNKNTPYEVLDRLKDDKGNIGHWAWIGIASHPDTSAELLKKLYAEHDDNIGFEAYQNLKRRGIEL